MGSRVFIMVRLILEEGQGRIAIVGNRISVFSGSGKGNCMRAGVEASSLAQPAHRRET